MKLFESKLLNRVAVWKLLGFVFWWIAFILLTSFFPEADMQFKIAILFWYITIWAFVGLMWVMDKHPFFPMPWWIRWSLIWAWMNFLLVLFIHDYLVQIASQTCYAWYSPYWLVLEWLIIWALIDYIITKCYSEGKKLVK